MQRGRNGDAACMQSSLSCCVKVTASVIPADFDPGCLRLWNCLICRLGPPAGCRGYKLQQHVMKHMRHFSPHAHSFNSSHFPGCSAFQKSVFHPLNYRDIVSMEGGRGAGPPVCVSVFELGQDTGIFLTDSRSVFLGRGIEMDGWTTAAGG